MPRPSPLPAFQNLAISKPSTHFYAYINYEDTYVQPLILSALEKHFPNGSYTLMASPSELPSPTSPYLHIGAYETLPFEHILAHPRTSLTNAYVIRKALIRKHYLSTTAYNWIVKNPSSILKTNMKPSCSFELDYAEFLDDALVEAWELQAGFQSNEGKGPEEREWWILKPGMSDRGQGIRLFSTYEELLAIFEEWEEDAPDSDDEADAAGSEQDGKDYIVTSHLRDFVAQPYIAPPLLLTAPSLPGPLPHKFHIRTYVLAIGSLKIFVYRPMLALFAASPYTPPWSSDSSDLTGHLTNTCLQTSDVSGGAEGDNYNTVHLLSSLPLGKGEGHAITLDSLHEQIFQTTHQIFEAAARGMSVHFQTLPNVFEVFGLDFLVDEKGTAWLLEVNAFPDFRQSGDVGREVVKGFWVEVVEKGIGGFFGGEGALQRKDESKAGDGEDLVLVGSVELGKR